MEYVKGHQATVLVHSNPAAFLRSSARPPRSTSADGFVMEYGDNQDQKQTNDQDQDLRGFPTESPEAGVLMNGRPPHSRGKNQPDDQHDCSPKVERQECAPEDEGRQFVA